VSNWGIATGEPNSAGPGAQGQLVRIQL
jgi:hypothetical protein